MNEFLSTLWSKLAEFATTYGFRLLAALVVLFVGTKLIKLVMRRISKSKQLAKLQKTAQNITTHAVKIALYALLIITVCSIMEIPMASIVGIVTSCALAIGLALQGSLANLAGGFMILLFKPFEVDDYIDNGSYSGTVVDIGVFYTTLKTPDNKKVVIPNGALSNGSIVNFSTHDTRRVDFSFGVAYASDIDLVRKVLLSVAESNDLVLKDPAPVVYLLEQADSALIFSLRVWVNKNDYWSVFFDINERAKKEFDKSGIEIPFPQLDVHLDK